ncbi:hypothetical protein BKA93DRAFT_743538 [Sparassis latifolia]
MTAYNQPVNPIRHSRAEFITEDLTKEKPKYGVYVQSTPNNTIVTLTRPNGNPILTLSGGKVGYKGANKATFEASSKCAMGVFEALAKEQEKEDLRWELFVSGFGSGRDAFHKALMAADPTIKAALRRITDRTPIKIGGTRAQKMKRR